MKKLIPYNIFNRGHALRITVGTMVLAVLLAGSAAALSNLGSNINGSIATGPMTWTASNFPAFWHENGISSELLAVLQPDLNSSQRVINIRNLVYNTTRSAVMYRVSDRKGLIVENGLGGENGFTKNADSGSDGFRIVTGGKNYSKLGWLGQPYVAVNGQASKLSKLVLEQNETSSKTLAVRETWDMGDGWTLTAQSIDANATPRQVWFVLSKDSINKDDKILAEGQVYTFYENSIAGESNVPVFVTYLDNISAGQTRDTVTLKYTWLISENVTQILAGDNFGILKVDSAGTFGFELRNYHNIILSRNTIINLLDGLNLVVNDSESLAYYPMMTSTLQPVAKFNISGFKINGTSDDGSGLEGWNIKLSCTTCGIVLTATTDSNGFYKFSDLPNGTYIITEEMKTGWINNTPMSQQVLISGNDKMNVNFTNQQVSLGGSISGFKINDLNGNGRRDAGENGLSNWEIELKGIGVETKDLKKETITDNMGFYKFDNLPAGRYLVKETLKKGYVPTSSPVRIITLDGRENSLDNNFTNRLAVLATLSSNDIKSLYKGENALNHIAELVDFGPRVAGGGAEKKAAEYIASKMVSYGLNVTTQEFPILYFEDKGSTLQVINGSSLNPNTLFYSPPGEFTAEIADCGLGYPENFTVCGASGKIALIQRGQLFFWQKVQNAANASALGAIVYNNRPGNFNGTLTFVTDIPAVSISDTEGAYLLELLKREPVTVHLKVDTLVQNRTSQNVIGTIKGTDPEQGIVYIGGHYDSVSAGPGANDDASGVGAMMEAARLLSNKGYRTKATLNFIAFGSEETGLDGSFNYVEANREEVSTKGIGMINLDMIGVGDTRLIGNIGLSSSNLTNYTRVKASAMSLNWEPFTAESNSDHTYFEAAGVPAVFIYQSEDPWYHTSNDTIDKINSLTLEENGELATATMYDWAKNPEHRIKIEQLVKVARSLKKVNVHHDTLYDED